eukprot:TRINITY_DN129_c0_g2_i1.p1 TRINITY_DN129_c0_g2~~TRINITY_DN129_c0_g2_i1.p1  ORF type:complete len:398 (+),score=109.08 TRINITY_DN129_c0_g2_i1:87-1196(+)
MRAMAAVALALSPTLAHAGAIARTPPMGWMSWEIFRCGNSHGQIREELYQQQTDHLVADGYLKAGYNAIHIDDCWEQKDPARVDGKLVADPAKFPSGMKALGDYMHSRGVKFGTYTDEGAKTCGGFPASGGNEAVDAKTFAEWGVDYLKVDGCGVPQAEYSSRYHAMGEALVNSGRDIEYSCSWPAYIGSNETTKPFSDMIAAHCNGWRNWADIQCNWNSLGSIIDHWGDYGEYLAQFAGPGHWHDPDMLLIGNGCVTPDEERTQLALWSISAAPLIMGNDLRNVTASGKATLQNEEAIAVDQDPKGAMGYRVSPKGPAEVWPRRQCSTARTCVPLTSTATDWRTATSPSLCTTRTQGPAPALPCNSPT